MLATASPTDAPAATIHTPDQRVRVFISSTLQELSDERMAARDAVTRLRLVPVMFELAARPHPPRQVYRAYLAQSRIFVGIYWQSYGWVGPGEEISGLEDEYRLSAGMPRLIYVKSPAPDREPALERLLARIKGDDSVSYQRFSEPAELQRLIEDDLAVLLSERFEMTRPPGSTPEPALAGALPTPATPLVDRERETAETEDLVVRQGVRLVTFTGPGGVGKTRLAVQAASRLASRFPDGVRFVDLASVRAGDLVPAAIAAGLGLNTSGGRLISDMVSYLRTKRLLLVLDNVEQVTDGAPLVAQLLAASPGLVVLVTSRAVLRLSGEYELAVPPLPVPPLGAGEPEDYASVRLFAARARAEAPRFELTRNNAPVIAEICRRLDGLPLAIELAAARIRLLPPRALLARLDDRMSLLTDGARDLPERQRTLRNTLDWSFGLLSANEQALFTQLGVFVGSFGLPAVTAICGHAVQGPVIDTLSSLVDSSLVRAEPSEDEPRFSLLETIREYASERLRGSAAGRDVHDRHAAYFLALAQPAATELHGAGQLAWLNRLEIRRGNLSAALSWLVGQDQPGKALDLGWATWRFWWLHGHAEELARHVDQIVAHSDGMSPRQRARALSGAGFVHLGGGDQAQALRLFKRSLPLYRQAGDRLGMGLNAAALGHLLASAQHESEYAIHLLEQTLAQLREMADESLTEPDRFQYLMDVALASNFLGQIDLERGDHDHAAELFTHGLSAAHSADDRFTLLISLYDLALSRQAHGDMDDAADLLRQGLSLAAEAGDQSSPVYYLEALADIAARQDHPARAVGLLAAAGAQLEAKGSGWLHAYVPRAPHGSTALAALRTRMDDAVFQQARTYGRSLTDVDAVRYALEDDINGTGQPDAP
jgi:predicted ATPase